MYIYKLIIVNKKNEYRNYKVYKNIGLYIYYMIFYFYLNIYKTLYFKQIV